MQTKTRLSILFLIILAFLSSCSSAPGQAQAANKTRTVSATVSKLFTITPVTPTPTTEPTATLTPTATHTPTATIQPTATLIPTATWAVAGPGEVIAPILMYHNIDPEGTSSRYNTTPEVFAKQMQALADWGYHTITAAQLTQAILEGAPLPDRPIVITFDDGHYSVYEYAFPIMQEHGFFGVTYIVANRLKSVGFTGEPQLKEMIQAGWEVGSHSYTHSDLSLDHSKAFNEINYSREHLSDSLDFPVTSFAYPYGAFDQYLGDRTSKWGYTNAMGLGTRWAHTEYSLFYLQRIEIQGGMNMDVFASLLPWAAPPDN